MQKKELAANILLLVVAIIWGWGFVAGKQALSTLSPVAVLMYRFTMASLLCFTFFGKRIVKTPRATAIKGCTIGTMQMCALAVQLIGLQYTTPANQSFLCTAYVVLVPFISWIVLRRKPQPKAFLAGFIALGGIGLISLKDGLTVSFGDSMSLAFAAIFGTQIVLTGMFVKGEADSIQLAFFQFLSAAVFSGAACIIGGIDICTFTGESLAGMLFLGAVNTFVALIGQNVGQKYTKDTTASLILSLESLFGFTFSVLYYGESVGWRLAAGGAMCFGAILISTVDKKRQSS
ncbi:MAG: DMT family transporter [Firmicutes bacterium]|nr:DMT family transporter [Bacillota bacterium]